MWKPANSQKIWPFRAPIVGSGKRIRPKRGGLARHSVESPQSLSPSANPQRKRKDKVKWMEHQMNELEEFHLSERAQGSVKTTESTQRSRRPGGKLEVSRGRIEVLIGGTTCCFLNKERLRWTDWGDYSHHTDWKWWDPCIPNTGPDWVHLRGGWSSKWKLCSRTSIIVMILSGSSIVASVWWNLWFCSPSQAQVVGFLLVNKMINNCHQLRGLLHFFYRSVKCTHGDKSCWSVGDKSLYYRLHTWKFAMWIFAHELGTELPNLLLSSQRQRQLGGKQITTKLHVHALLIKEPREEEIKRKTQGPSHELKCTS